MLKGGGILAASVELSGQDSEHKGCPLCLPAFSEFSSCRAPTAGDQQPCLHVSWSAASLSGRQISFCLQFSVTTTPLQAKEWWAWLWGSPESRAMIGGISNRRKECLADGKEENAPDQVFFIGPGQWYFFLWDQRCTGLSPVPSHL